MKASRRVLSKYVAAQLSSGADRGQTLQQLAAYIITYRLQSQTEQIISDIARNIAETGYVAATVTSARPLSEEIKQTVVEFIKAHDDARDVELKTVVDPQLIGGIIIDTPNQRLDTSVASKLKRLKHATN